MSRAARVSASLRTRRPSSVASVTVWSRWFSAASSRVMASARAVPHSEVRATLRRLPSRSRADQWPSCGEVLDVDGGVEHLAAERLDVRGWDPRGAEPGGDLRRVRAGGAAPAPSAATLARNAVVGRRQLLGRRRASWRTLPDRYCGGGDQRAGRRVVVDQVAELRRGPRVGVGAEQLGDPVEVDRAGLVEADGDGFVGGVDAEAFVGRVDDPLGEDRRRSGLLGLVVEHLERGDERPVRVVAEAAHAGPDPAHDLVAGLGIAATGAGLARPVDRPVDAGRRRA